MNNLIACCGVVSSCDLMTKLIILTLVCWHGNCYHCSSLSLAARGLSGECKFFKVTVALHTCM